MSSGQEKREASRPNRTKLNFALREINGEGNLGSARRCRIFTLFIAHQWMVYGVREVFHLRGQPGSAVLQLCGVTACTSEQCPRAGSTSNATSTKGALGHVTRRGRRSAVGAASLSLPLAISRRLGNVHECWHVRKTGSRDHSDCVVCGHSDRWLPT